MSSRFANSTLTQKAQGTVLPAPSVLQRKCACGQHTASDACDSCKREAAAGQTLQRAATHARLVDDVPPIVHEVLRSPGQSLDAATRDFMEPRFAQDFSRVRVHTDSRAAESAHAVGALAYTASDHIVFQKGQFSPASSPGQRLLAHELTHVLQQRSGLNQSRPSAGEETRANPQTKLQIGTEGDRYEQEAERVAGSVVEGGGAARSALRSAAPGSIQMQPGPKQPKVVPPVKPTTAQQKIINEARKAASNRTQTASFRLRALVQPGPVNSPHLEAKFESIRVAQLTLDWPNPNMDRVEKVVDNMVTHLLGAEVMIAAAGTKDPMCGRAYVMGQQPPIVLCPAFFSGNPEDRVRTMIHEAAHLAGIGKPGPGEVYCPIFKCDNTCGGPNAADSWSHFVHCLSGQPADPDLVKGGKKSPGGGKKP